MHSLHHPASKCEMAICKSSEILRSDWWKTLKIEINISSAVFEKE